MEKEEILEDMVSMQVSCALLTVLGYFPHVITSWSDSDEIFIPEYLLFYSYHGFILTFVVSAITSWICYGIGKYKIIRWIILIPFFWIFWGAFWFIIVESYY
ncbi:hypothetical protein SAMN05444673_2172 [Bacillus sp. OV166]|uniref:hypothetical protein n=1 Tax=Bacillus sp. OV166 TaxID=1882763 RepID=UPI000A2AD896|nr:hypothetical protein [Bacillus sp. OV166]SMQ72228.1 hypothetical protein SAMN05444673_2172 [Bacillus sp. OV166]